MADQQPLKFRVYDASGRAVRIKRRYLILVVLGIATVAGAFLFIPFYVTTTPGFCSNCHLMEPFITSWEHSTHAKFGCDRCHVKPGVLNHLVNQVIVSKNVYLNFIGRAEMPKEIRSATNENCLQTGCHTTNRKASTSGDLIIPHKEHVEMRGLECKDCHFNVVHTPEGGTPVPPMGVCAMCHDGERAPNACTTCHRSPPSAAEEHPGLALAEHGQIAKGRERDCFKCHHSDQSFCARSGCHDPGVFEKLTEEQRMEERFH
ncbi:MAG: NapC/NirT family cytochrome c [Actinobacteria bacterium]|nr:NapC/NirT family cytochrome c [Actinomycetota bacterium]